LRTVIGVKPKEHAGGEQRWRTGTVFKEQKRGQGYGAWLTVCVTRAGAGGGTPSDWENAEA